MRSANLKKKRLKGEKSNGVYIFRAINRFSFFSFYFSLKIYSYIFLGHNKVSYLYILSFPSKYLAISCLPVFSIYKFLSKYHITKFFLGHMRPSSPLLDSVRDQFEGQDQMAKDFAAAFVNSMAEQNQLFDITFHVGQVNLHR